MNSKAGQLTSPFFGTQSSQMRDFVPAARVIVTNRHHTVLLFQRRTSIDHNQPHQTTTAVMTLLDMYYV